MPRKFLALAAALAAFLLLPLSSGAALAEKRVALVIGNGSYQNVARLPNPSKDATAVADLFKRAGFEWVKMRQDLGSLDFKRALREFMEAAQDADVAVVYYAGHGIQVREVNYIIPVDAKLATEFDVQDEAIPLDRILAALEPAKRLRLVILDACRENPFAGRMKVANATRSIGRGLARVEPENNVLVAYAAKGGQVALDGAGDNSPFTAALVKHLAVPGLDIRLAFGRIRDEVLKSTGFKQEPFVYGSLGGDAISLVPAPAQPKPELATNVKADYELVREIGTQKAWEAFLSSHKEGFYAELAREQLAKLVQQGKAPASTASGTTQKVSLAKPEPVLSRPSAPSSKERADWELIRDSGDRAKLRDFIARYPASPLAEQAKNRLDALDRAAQEREEKARAEQEALRREQDAKRLEAEDAARKAADAARQREEQALLAKSAEAAGKPQDDTCSRDEQKLAQLRAFTNQGWAREDLRRLQRETACDRIRSEVVALLSPSAAPAAKPTPPVAVPAAPAAKPAPPVAEPAPPIAEPVAPVTQPLAPPKPAVNTPDLVRSAQRELRRLGCFAGQDDGKLGNLTSEAIKRYLSEKGEPATSIEVTDGFLADLKEESGRVCPLVCARGEHPEGERCVADARPEPTPEARPAKREKSKATARQRDQAQESRRQATKREERREAVRSRQQERSRAERAASRPAPQPAARSQAAAPPAPAARSGGMVGVGF